MRKTGLAVGAVLLMGVALALLVGGSAASAQGDDTCQLDFGQFSVTTAEEFNAAIDCFNSLTFDDEFDGVQIELLADVTAATVAGESVFNEITQPEQFQFLIDGAGYSISRGINAPGTTADLLGVAAQSQAEVLVFSTDFELGPDDRSAIRHDGINGSLRMRGVSINGAAGVGTTTGVRTAAMDELSIGESFISGTAVGVDTGATIFDVSYSTIDSSQVDLIAQDDAGIGVIHSSTLAGPVGIQLGDGGIRVSNTTILGDGAAAKAGANAGDGGGASLFVSSVVGSCSTPDLDANPDELGPGFIDQGFNVGGCFGDGTTIDTTLADNGCEIPTPIGCAPTVALRPGSPARGAGDCSPNNGGFGGIDQRGAPRSPVGPGCDAGSFEDVPGWQLCNRSVPTYNVSTADEFNEAIGCYNAADDDPERNEDYQIFLQDDIQADTVAGSSVFTEVVQQNDVQLVIWGEGFTLRRGPGAGNAQADLLGFSGSTQAFIALFDLHLEAGPGERSAISSDGPRISLFRSAITASDIGTSATGIVGTGGQVHVDMIDSWIDGVATGIQLDGTRLEMTRSTVNSTDVDLDLTLSDLSASFVENSTLAGPVGLQMASGSLSTFNSTVLGDGGVYVGQDPQASDIAIRYFSSIVGSCTLPMSAGAFPDDVFAPSNTNAGGCFEPGETIDVALADNGCDLTAATPVGCPQTVAIGFDSPARLIGDCSDIDFDQRGVPRTVVGPGCDAGSFEWEPPAACSFGNEPQPARRDFDVGTADEFNTAMICANTGSGGTFRINLNNDIAADTIAGDAVFVPFEPEGTAELVINGNDNTVNRQVAAGTAPAPVLLLVPGQFSRTRVNDLGIRVGPHDLAGIISVGNGDFDATSVAVSAVTAGSTGIGLDINHGSGDVNITGSILDGLRVGARLTGDVVGVRFSTITSTETDVEAPDSDLTTVAFSTLTAPVGVDVERGFVSIAAATVLGDIAPARPGSSARTLVWTSIAGSCTADVAVDAQAPNPVVIDEGGNVGGCFVPGQVVDTALADNGCVRTTPTGCTPTIALSPASPARGAGDCTETEGGTLAIDQRGFPRSPLGPGCDAGAFEDLACDNTTDFVVGEEGALNVAITCFNLATQAGEYTITLDGDITLTRPDQNVSGLRPEVSGFSAIDQPSPSLNLTIDGAGFTLDSSISTNRVVSMAPTNQAPVAIDNLQLDLHLTKFEAIDNEGSGSLSIRNSAMLDDDLLLDRGALIRNNAIRSVGALTVEDSHLQASGSAIVQDASALTIRASTLEAEVAIVAGTASSVDVSNSTLDSLFVGATVGSGTTGTITNTTFNGAAVYGTPPGGFGVTVSSSFFTGECPQLVTLGLGNAGGCFDGDETGAPLPLTNNGCVTETPAGCAPTAVLSPGSVAIGAGLCTGVPTDQRGEPRTPEGPGCDAGAYETPGFVPPGSLGDVDGDTDIDNDDVQALLTFLSGGQGAPTLDTADMNGDGEIKLDDALLLAQQVAGPG